MSNCQNEREIVKAWSIPVWILGIIINIGTFAWVYLQPASSASAAGLPVTDMQNKALILIICAGASSLILFIMGLISRSYKHKVLRLVVTLLTLGYFLLNLSHFTGWFRVSLNLGQYWLALFGSTLILAAAVMVWFTSSEERAKIKAQKKADRKAEKRKKHELSEKENHQKPVAPAAGEIQGDE
ncbi:MAG: hypothetical protein QM613_01130 [Micrococcaceae bacterium]